MVDYHRHLKHMDEVSAHNDIIIDLQLEYQEFTGQYFTPEKMYS